MFISNEEKRYLFDQIKALAKEQSSAASEITFLKAKIKVLEAKKKADGALEGIKKDIADEDRRARQRMYARKYYAKKQLEKKAQNVSS
jgi:hypothetical protein